ncbi:gamma-glutamyl phosphate reductase [Klebsiella pneumoniae]|uniref:Gamma-glutamyl phosphate reductase n=1 Tax=Klebsiella pneumoniae TaxID=573 RepID=A0A3S4KIM1_KLEPN|nr:gamma-glutamyl phosphate reductase [Klebsiella pneumoniae]
MLEQMGIAAKAASWQLALLSSREKNQVLEKIADYLEAQTDVILRANAEDLAEARANGLSEAMLDRLALTPARLSGIASDVRQVCNLADPVGQVIDGGLLDSGLRIERRRVPLGVIGVIYEARPNVTVDAASPVSENRQRGDPARRERDLAHQRRHGEGDPAGAAGVRSAGRRGTGYREPGSRAGGRNAEDG